MERPPRLGASKVSDFQRYHLSGELKELVQGKVGTTVSRWEGIHTAGQADSHMENPQEAQGQLKAELEQRQIQREKLQQQAEEMQLQNEVEKEKMLQLQWETAISQLEEAREAMTQEHQKNLEKMKSICGEAVAGAWSEAVTWLQGQLRVKTGLETEQAKKLEEEKRKKVQELKRQQEELQRQIAEMEGTAVHTGPHEDDNPQTEQELWLQQVCNALGPKVDNPDSNKALLKALITGQNKATGTRGTSTLKPEIISRLCGDEEFSMPKWLASLNKQDEGESDIARYFNKDVDDSDCRAECKHTKMRSGMLDRSTTNIQRKEVWPQKNLGEDWADEEIEFKQIRFEHLVAGETRTIETCTDPAQILGRLRLLRCLAYLKLRGMEWHLLRKMYAAILSSMKTGEYSWKSNFDRFETILYRKALTEAPRTMDRDRER